MISEKIAKAGHLLCVETAGVSELAVGVVELAVDALRVLGVELEVRAIYRLLMRRFGQGAYGSGIPGSSKTGCSCCGASMTPDDFDLGILDCWVAKVKLQARGESGRGVEWEGTDFIVCGRY